MEKNIFIHFSYIYIYLGKMNLQFINGEENLYTCF